MCSLVTFCFQSLLISNFFSRPVKNTALTGTSSDFLCAQTETSLFLSSILRFYGIMRAKKCTRMLKNHKTEVVEDKKDDISFAMLYIICTFAAANLWPLPDIYR